MSFQVDVKLSRFLSPGEEVNFGDEVFTVPKDGRHYAAVAGEFYAQTGIGADLLNFLLNAKSKEVEAVAVEKSTGHGAFGVLFSASQEEYESILQKRREDAQNPSPVAPVADTGGAPDTSAVPVLQGGGGGNGVPASMSPANPESVPVEIGKTASGESVVADQSEQKSS
jgi:hypothetical protein